MTTELPDREIFLVTSLSCMYRVEILHLFPGPRRCHAKAITSPLHLQSHSAAVSTHTTSSGRPCAARACSIAQGEARKRSELAQGHIHIRTRSPKSADIDQLGRTACLPFPRTKKQRKQKSITSRRQGGESFSLAFP